MNLSNLILLLLFIVCLPPIVLANLAEVSPQSPFWNQLRPFTRQSCWLSLVLLIFVFGVGALAFKGTSLILALSIGSGALISILVFWRSFRLALSLVIPINPDNLVHTVAVAFSFLFVSYSFGTALSTTLHPSLNNPQHLQLLDLVLQEVPFIFIALLGVGFAIRRNVRETRIRLGLTKPSLIQVLLGLFCAGVFILFSNGTDFLAQHLTPGLYKQVDTVSNDLFGPLSQQPLGIATIALSAGIAEEILFRGALQPRLGLVWTAVIFASSHTQYAISITEASVLILALGLGVLRRYTNTTTCIICHVAYDAVVAMELTGYYLFIGLILESVVGVVLLLNLNQRLRGSGKSPVKL